jgi:hypothetical protein
MDLLISIEHLPREIMGEILPFVAPDYAALAGVSHQWNIFVRQWVEKRYPEVAERSIGEKLWRELGAKDVGTVSKIPLGFYPDVASGEFMLTWIPEFLDGKPMKDLNTIDEFLMQRTAKSIYYFSLADIGITEVKPFKGHWFLMSKDLLKDSRRKTFSEQEKMLKDARYTVPHCLGAIVSILLHHRRTGELVYPEPSNGQRETFTRVQENTNSGYKIIVGNMTPTDLCIQEDFCNTVAGVTIGIARSRKSCSLCEIGTKTTSRNICVIC